jgi:hypothetical protein
LGAAADPEWDRVPTPNPSPETRVSGFTDPHDDQGIHDEPPSPPAALAFATGFLIVTGGLVVLWRSRTL